MQFTGQRRRYCDPNGSEEPTAMTRETQRQLYRVLNAHTSDLEIARGVTSGPDLDVLDRRIEAARLLLEWIWQALEPHAR